MKFNFKDIKFRKESTYKRYKLILGLSPNGVILQAIAFAPTVQARGLIALDIFTCLLNNIKPKGSFGCDLEALDLVQNRVDLELQSDSEATVRLNSSST